MTELRILSDGAIPSALEKAAHYRLLNEADNAESICLDVLALEPQHQRALVLLLLSRTDQIDGGSPDTLERAREVLPRLNDAYDRAYYGGLICERQAKSVRCQRGRHSKFVAFDWFQLAMEQYQIAIDTGPPETDDAVLRWNTCIRMIERYRLRPADPEGQVDHGIE